MKKYVFLFLCIWLSFRLQKAAAQDFQYNLFNLAPFSVSPALVAEDDKQKAIFHYRRQRVSPEAGYSIPAFTLVRPLVIKNLKSFPSIGINFFQDSFTGEYEFTNQRIAVGLAYNLPIGKNEHLLFGLQFDYFSQTLAPGQFTTGSQYEEGIGYNPSLPTGENFSQLKLSYYAFKPGLFYVKNDNDGQLQYRFGGSVGNLSNTFRGYFDDKQALNPALTLNGKMNAYQRGITTIYPEVLYTMYNGGHLLRLGAVASNAIRDDSVKLVLDAGLWFSSAKAVTATLQMQYNAVSLALSYETGALTGNSVPGNIFEIALAFQKPVKPINLKFKKKKKKGKRDGDEDEEPDDDDDKLKKKRTVKKPVPKKKKAYRFGSTEYAQKNIGPLKPKQPVQLPFAYNLHVNDSLPIAQPQPIDTGYLEKTPDDVPFVLNGKLYIGKLGPAVYFAFGSSKITKQYHDYLDEIVGYLKANNNIKILLFGHTDDIGDEETNNKLSEGRAKNVKMYLMQSGVSEERIVNQGHGKDKPQLPNDSDENRSKNRRVELILFQ